jgi:hypothetical protein
MRTCDSESDGESQFFFRSFFHRIQNLFPPAHGKECGAYPLANLVYCVSVCVRVCVRVRVCVV